MGKGEQKMKEPKEWDRRPWPASGDKELDGIYAAVGRALSQWERLEGALSLLFSEFITEKDSSTAGARRSFAAVRTFEGRLEMLRAASSAYFEAAPDPELQNQWTDILSRASKLSERRNEITHGVVDFYAKEDFQFGRAEDISYALYPTYASFRQRDINNKPTYCMTSSEVDYFWALFYQMQKPIYDLISGLLNHKSRVSFQRKYRVPSPSSANPEADPDIG